MRTEFGISLLGSIEMPKFDGLWRVNIIAHVSRPRLVGSETVRVR